MFYACTHRDIYMLAHTSTACNQSGTGVPQFGMKCPLRRLMFGSLGLEIGDITERLQILRVLT